MTFRERAEKAAREVLETLQASPSDEQTERVLNVIERATIEAVLEEQQRCVHVAMECCSVHRDLAQKVGEEMRRSELVLIANLSALR